MNDLNGIRIAVTRPIAQAGDLITALNALGATAIPCPVIRTVPPGDMLALASARRDIAEFDWIIFTSANGVDGFLGGENPEKMPRVAAIGPATTAVLAAHGVRPYFMPDTYLAAEIPAGLGDLSGKRVLLPRAEIAGEALPEALVEAGASVREVAAYQTLRRDPGDPAIAQLKAGVDAITFTSPSTVQGLMAALAAHEIHLEKPLAACIGPITANAAAEAGFGDRIVATEHTANGLVDMIKRHFAGQ